MATADRKIVVVFGATGIQGGSVARTLLQDPIASKQFQVRAVTRDISRPAANALLNEGAEVVEGDLDDKESLRRVIKDAHAVYAVTNFALTMDPATETQQGKNVADIAKELDVKHLIWSAQPSVSKITNNKLNLVAHFESKALVTEHIRSLSIPHTIVYVGGYTSLILDSVSLISKSPLTYGLIVPEPVNAKTKLPLINASADVGKFVKGILLQPEVSLNREFNLATKYYTFGELATILKESKLPTILHTMDKSAYKSGLASQGLPEWFQEDLLQVMQFTEEYGIYGNNDDIEEAQKLFVTEPLSSFEDSLKNNPAFARLLEQSQSSI